MDSAGQISSAQPSPARPLVQLLEALTCTLSGRPLDGSLLIGSVCANTEEVGPSSLFVAVKGTHHDGHRFLGEAAARGAAAVVVERGALERRELADLDLVVISVADSRAALARLAAAFHRHPAAALTMIGITGTNGKTTVSYLIEQALAGFGVRTGVIGTVDYRFRARGGRQVARPAPLTTPDPVTLQALLREMADSGVTHVIMEVSSHALHQHRLEPIEFDLAVFTNLSQDHLDYHGTMAEYFAAKSLLFSDHMRAGGAVVVTEQEGGADTDTPPRQIIELCRARALRTVLCGASDAAAVRLGEHRLSTAGVACTLIDQRGRAHSIESALIGRFNIANLQTAFTALVTLGYDAARSASLLGQAAGAPGRAERVRLAEKEGGQPTVIVDYAHTPDALEKVLTALKGLAPRTLVCVFGCGGDRDRTKRYLMGEIAAGLADIVIVTDDNPRTEDPAEIRRAVVEGVAGGAMRPLPPTWLEHPARSERGYLEIGGRARAIAAAVTRSGPGDLVLIAGKGHENYQIIGRDKRFFDDALCARQSSLAWDLRSVQAATGGTVVREADITRFTTVSTDTRAISGGEVFVALHGEVHDGHHYLGQAEAQGARCLVVSDPAGAEHSGVCWVRVDDTLAALGDLARHRLGLVRSIASPVVVGLTGSCGKTTVKEMTAAIFEKRWPDRPDRPAGRVLKTAGNFNNLVGLPLSLLPVSAQHRALVLEMGMNRPGEIARLTEIGDPDICCITNVHQAHLEGLGSIDGVTAAKGELFERCRPDSVLVINCDEPRLVALGEKSARRTVGFAVTAEGVASNPEVRAERISADDQGHLRFQLVIGKARREVTIAAPGLHNAANCCAAAAIAHAAAIDIDTIVAGLEQFRSSSRRMERLTSPAGLKILNDSYNANPASMASALKTLAGLPARARLAVLGDMLELGEASADLHRSIGNVAARSELRFLALVGNFAEQIRLGALASGMDPGRIRVFPDKREVAGWVGDLLGRGELRPGDWLLVKASRGLALDTVVEQIMEGC